MAQTSQCRFCCFLSLFLPTLKSVKLPKVFARPHFVHEQYTCTLSSSVKEHVNVFCRVFIAVKTTQCRRQTYRSKNRVNKTKSCMPKKCFSNPLVQTSTLVVYILCVCVYVKKQPFFYPNKTVFETKTHTCFVIENRSVKKFQDGCVFVRNLRSISIMCIFRVNQTLNDCDRF